MKEAEKQKEQKKVKLSKEERKKRREERKLKMRDELKKELEQQLKEEMLHQMQQLVLDSKVLTEKAATEVKVEHQVKYENLVNKEEVMEMVHDQHDTATTTSPTTLGIAM